MVGAWGHARPHDWTWGPLEWCVGLIFSSFLSLFHINPTNALQSLGQEQREEGGGGDLVNDHSNDRKSFFF